ncbi:hypothetical protein WA158_004666 [Blastocystis sp. Blastoise]
MSMLRTYINSVVITFFQLLLSIIVAPIFFVGTLFSQLYYFLTTKEEDAKVVLITGATSGIGEGLAKKYAQTCSKLILLGRNAEKLAKTQKALNSDKCEVIIHSVDVADKEKMHDIVSQYKDLDLVIANAGVAANALSFDETPSILQQTTEKIFATNVDGVFNTIFPAIDNMKLRRQGQVCIVSSISGMGSAGFLPVYGATKCAVTSYGEGLRAYLNAWNIKVNVVTPGFVNTHMADNLGVPSPMSITTEQCVDYIYDGLRADLLHVYCEPMFYICMTVLYKTIPATMKKVYLSYETSVREKHTLVACEYFEKEYVNMKKPKQN